MKKNLLLPSLLPLLLFVVLAGAARAAASACPQTETGVPVCAYYTRADVVFYGKAIKTENVGGKEDFPEGARKIRFQVLENFKGADNPTLTLIAAGGCGSGIKQGQSWVVYARLDQGGKSFYAFRSSKIDPKGERAELEALRLSAAGKNETTFAGRFVTTLQPYNYEAVEIIIESGGRRLSRKTDADGAFSFAPLAEGKYKVRLEFPFRAKLDWDQYLLKTSFTEGVPSVFDYEIELNQGDCIFNFFDVLKNGR